MSAQAVLYRALRAGFTVEIRGDKLHVAPTPPADLVEQLRQHKTEIVALLATPADPPRGPCIHCGQPVTPLGATHGFRSGFGDLVHLRCP